MARRWHGVGKKARQQEGKSLRNNREQSQKKKKRRQAEQDVPKHTKDHLKLNARLGVGCSVNTHKLVQRPGVLASEVPAFIDSR